MFSPQDIVEVQDHTFLSAIKIWDSWSKDPIKAAVARAVLSCESRVDYVALVFDMFVALSQGHLVCFYHWKGVESITEMLQECFKTFRAIQLPDDVS